MVAFATAREPRIARTNFMFRFVDKGGWKVIDGLCLREEG